MVVCLLDLLGSHSPELCEPACSPGDLVFTTSLALAASLGLPIYYCEQHLPNQITIN